MMAYWTGLNLDIAHHHDDEAIREQADDIVQIMTPIIKAYLTDEGYNAIDQGLQSMGGSGFTQDWEIEQLLRDARISRIYEGTNGIQSLDLVGRKLMLKGGRLPKTYFKAMHGFIQQLHNEDHKVLCEHLLAELQACLHWLAEGAMKNPDQAGATATPMLKLFATCTMAVMWATMANVAKDKLGDGDYSDDFYHGKIKTADHFMRLARAQAAALRSDIESGSASVMAIAETEF